MKHTLGIRLIISICWLGTLPGSLVGQTNPPGTQQPILPILPPGQQIILPKQRLPGSQTPGSVVPTQSPGYPTPGPSLENPGNLDLEGVDPVLDEEEASFSSKPKQSNSGILEDSSRRSNVFGHELFSDSTQFNYDLTDDRVPPDNYIVGPGDRFGVTVYGPSELSESLMVGADGAILRSYMGKIYVAGMTYAEARALLRTKYHSIVSQRSQIEILLVPRQRSVRVNIVGEVRRPGTYQIPASTTAFNALFAAGGITPLGSVRNIQIKRNGETVQIMDLYDYLVFGKDEPIFLEENDFIFVPVQGRIVGVTGAVRRPKEYELQGAENLKSLLQFAGGLSYDALRKKAQVARLDRITEREVLIDFDLGAILDSAQKDFFLLPGDKLIVRTVNKGAFNTVQIQGNIEYPGNYQLENGERLADAVLKAGGIGIDAFRERAYVIRFMPQSSEVRYIPIDLGAIFPLDTVFADTTYREMLAADTVNNIRLQAFDIIQIFSKSDFEDENIIEVEGQVRKPGLYLTTDSMTLRDLLYLVGGPKEDADLNNAELSIITRAEFWDVDRYRNKTGTGQGRRSRRFGTRLDDAPTESAEPTEAVETTEDEGPASYEQVVQRIALGENWQQNLALDTLHVRRFDRIRIYSKYDFIFFQYIDVEGAVRLPGRYQLKRGMTLKDLLYLAGGLEEDADVNEVELYRDIDLKERGNFNLGTDEREIVRIDIEEDWQNGRITDSVEVTGYHKIVVRSERDFFVQGQVIVKGLVNNPDTFDVVPNMTLLDLFYMAGGLKMEADFDNIELYRVIETENATGEIIPVPVVVNRIATVQQWQKDSTLNSIPVNAFDMVFVRKNPEFELQEIVHIIGEVLVPGEYVKARKAERLSSLVARAGGVTELADLEGAYLLRQNIGAIAIKLDKALKRRGSKYDIPLLEGDTLVLPPRIDVIIVAGNVLKPNQILFEPNKTKFKYYVKQAGGFDRRTKRKLSTVTYVNGRVQRVSSFLGIRNYPEVEQGAIIYVAAKPEKAPRPEGAPRARINLQEILAGATSILTFYLLVDRTIIN
ncbi:MAG: hypothetical protein OHK0039_35260 [Bacteroidia bacterium]